VHVQPGLELDEQTELVIYRVAQEALTNVARHAGGRRAEVRLARRRLEIDDDGRGRGDGAEGGGIRGMRERAVLIGAALKLGTSPLGGTRVTLELP
jgi:two-component system sensor histidine kinase UhpB